MGDVARAVLEHFEPLEGIAIGDAQSAIGEHDVLPFGRFHPRPDGVPRTAVLFIANHVQLDTGGDIDGSGGLGRMIHAAVINDDDFAFHVMGLQKARCGLHIPGDLPTLFEGRYHDG